MNAVVVKVKFIRANMNQIVAIDIGTLNTR